MAQSVWDYLLLRARLGPHELAVHAPRGPVSRLALVREVAGLATELLELGLGDAPMVGLAFENSYLHLLLVLALDRLSIPSTSLPMPLQSEALATHARHYGVTALIASEPALADPPCRWIRMAEQHSPRIARADQARLAAVSPPADSLLRVIWSSGTTGGPKGTPLARAKQMRRLETANFQRGHAPETRHFLAMGLGTVYGYNTALGLLMAGGAVILPGSGAFFDLAKALGINATGLNVQMLRALLGPQPDGLRRLESLRIDVMGSSLPPRLARETRHLLTPKLTMIYGTTEAVTIATGDASLCIADASAVGFLVPWIAAEIVDESDQPLPPRREGILRVRGEVVVDSYYGEAPGAAATVRKGWFYPGDIGTLADGLLRITGRHSEAIRHGGTLVGSVPIEAALVEMPGIVEAAIFPLAAGKETGEEICAALVLAAGADLDSLLAAMRARLGAQAPTQVMALAQLPRNANGKIVKRELQDRMRQARQAAAP